MGLLEYVCVVSRFDAPYRAEPSESSPSPDWLTQAPHKCATSPEHVPGSMDNSFGTIPHLCGRLSSIYALYKESEVIRHRR